MHFNFLALPETSATSHQSEHEPTKQGITRSTATSNWPLLTLCKWFCVSLRVWLQFFYYIQREYFSLVIPKTFFLFTFLNRWLRPENSDNSHSERTSTTCTERNYVFLTKGDKLDVARNQLHRCPTIPLFWTLKSHSLHYLG